MLTVTGGAVLEGESQVALVDVFDGNSNLREGSPREFGGRGLSELPSPDPSLPEPGQTTCWTAGCPSPNARALLPQLMKLHRRHRCVCRVGELCPPASGDSLVRHRTSTSEAVTPTSPCPRTPPPTAGPAPAPVPQEPAPLRPLWDPSGAGGVGHGPVAGGPAAAPRSRPSLSPSTAGAAAGSRPRSGIRWPACPPPHGKSRSVGRTAADKMSAVSS